MRQIILVHYQIEGDMVNLRFEKAKIQKELRYSGNDYIFLRPKFNKYKEETGEYEEINFRAIYHETSEYISETVKDSARYFKKKIPKLLGLYEECKLKVDDKVIINNKEYKVNGIINVQEWNIIADVSLEVIEDGNEI